MSVFIWEMEVRGEGADVADHIAHGVRGAGPSSSSPLVQRLCEMRLETVGSSW